MGVLRNVTKVVFPSNQNSKTVLNAKDVLVMHHAVISYIVVSGLKRSMVVYFVNIDVLNR